MSPLIIVEWIVMAAAMAGLLCYRGLVRRLESRAGSTARAESLLTAILLSSFLIAPVVFFSLSNDVINPAAMRAVAGFSALVFLCPVAISLWYYKRGRWLPGSALHQEVQLAAASRPAPLLIRPDALPAPEWWRDPDVTEGEPNTSTGNETT